MVDLRERFLIVVFTWRGPAKVDELKPVFDLAIDWVRIGANTWILWTNTNAAGWFPPLQPHLGAGDSLFISELNLSTVNENYTGWQDKWIWDWFDKHR